MVSFVSDIALELETWNSILCLSWQEKPRWKTTVITWANLLLDRLSFTEVIAMSSPYISISAPTALYIPAICLCQGRAGAVQISLRFIPLQGEEVDGADDRREASALGQRSEAACLHVPVAGKTTHSYNQNFTILTETVVYPGWQMGGGRQAERLLEQDFVLLGATLGVQLKYSVCDTKSLSLWLTIIR